MSSRSVVNRRCLVCGCPVDGTYVCDRAACAHEFTGRRCQRCSVLIVEDTNIRHPADAYTMILTLFPRLVCSRHA